MYEYEYRLKAKIDSFEELKNILKNDYSFYSVKYIKGFRSKGKNWELKKKLRQVVVFYEGTWIPFIESREKPFSDWKKKDFKVFYESIAFYQNPFDFEQRYEIKLSDKAKLYGYEKNKHFGLIFELEICSVESRLKDLPINTKDLYFYRHIFEVFTNLNIPPYVLYKCVRNPVIITHKRIDTALKAIKYNGTFGLIYSYSSEIHEIYEDNQCFVFKNTSIVDGAVFGAERMENIVILLYVAQIRGLKVHNTHDVLLNFLPSLQHNLPKRYQIQKYYNIDDKLPYEKNSDGIIYHDKDDKIYKLKDKQTVDLLYVNGFFVTQKGLIQCLTTGLENGIVYECDLNLNPIRPRYDRFLSNKLSQINKIFKYSSKSLAYSLEFEK